MGRYRAIMTDTDREYISGKGDATDTQRYQAVSRVRSRINEELAKDVLVLERHHSDLLDELREVVCDDGQERPAAMPSTVEPEAEPATVEELTASLDMRSFGREEEARREALRAVLRVLKEEGSASTSALKSAAWEAYQPDARPNEDTYPEVLNLWNNAIRTYGFDELDVVESGTEHERQGGYVWVGHE